MSEEYIPCEMAARGVTMNRAEILYPTPANPKRLSEVKAKRAKYVEEHWREVHPQVVAELHRWDNRQKYLSFEQHVQRYYNEKIQRFFKALPFGNRMLNLYIKLVDFVTGLKKVKDRYIPRINHWEEHLE